MSLTYSQAVEQTITAGEQIHQIVNGTATTEVTVEDGSKVPSVRKALLDNFYFKDPIAWQVGQTENVFNQLRQFTDGSWWYAPSATASNPISMGVTPVGNPLWKIYDFDAIGKLEPRIDEALRRSYADAGYNVVGTFQAGFTYVNANDVGIDEATGKGYTGPAGAVPAGTNPASGGFVDVSEWGKGGYPVVNSADYGLSELNSGLENCKALQRISARLTAAGGGCVIFQPGTYIVGHQMLTGAFGAGYSYAPEKYFEAINLEYLRLVFEGCTFKVADGMHYGSFNPVTGVRYDPPAGAFYNNNYHAPIGRIFLIQGVKRVTISGQVEVDGNDANTIIGGRFGDKGYQIWCQAFYIRDHQYLDMDASTYLHHWLTDCFYLAGAQGTTHHSNISNMSAMYAGRNTVTIAGGSNITFSDSTIAYGGNAPDTGYGLPSGIQSLPACAVDIETEVNPADNIKFVRTRFIDSENGVLCESFNRVSNVQFIDCYFRAKIKNSTCLYWSMSDTLFKNCRFEGFILTAGPSSNANNPAKDVIFDKCLITNVMADGTTSYGRAGKYALIDSTNSTTVNGKVLRTNFIDTKFVAKLTSDAAGRTDKAIWVATSKIKNCTLDVSGSITSPVTVALLYSSIIDGFVVNNSLDYVSIADPDLRPYLGGNGAKIYSMYLSKNLSSEDGKLTITNATPYLSGGGNYGWWSVPADFDYQNDVKPEFCVGLRKGAMYPDVTKRYEGPQLIRSATSMPTSGEYSRGDVILNWAAGAGGVFGWQCTTTGTAGSTAVFKIITNIGA